MDGMYWMDGWDDGWMNGWMDDGMNGWMDGKVCWIHEYINGRIYGWLDLMDGWMAWMDGSMNVWMG